MVQVGIGKTSVSDSLMKCRNFNGWHQNRGVNKTPGGAWRVPVYWPGGVRHRGDVSPICRVHGEREKARDDTAVVWLAARGRVPGGESVRN